MNRRDINFVLQNSEITNLKNVYEKIKAEQNIKVMQEPNTQTLLLPVKDPISEGEFYAGEVLVTTTTVEVNGSKGWAMVMDDNSELSMMIAVIDGCFASGLYIDTIKRLFSAADTYICESRKENNQMTNATKVNFELM